MTKRPKIFLLVGCIAIGLALTPLAVSAAATVGMRQTAQSLTILGSGYVGSSLTVVGFGYTAGETVTLNFDGSQVGVTTARQAIMAVGSKIGRISATVTIPDLATVGSHTISGVGQVSGVTLTASVNVQANWRQQGFSAAGGRYNPNDVAISPANVSTLTPYWHWTDAATSMGQNAPSVVAGVVYIGTGNSLFHALNAATGAHLWDVYVPENTNGQAAVSDNLAYTTGYNLTAIDVKTGQIVWDTATLPIIFSDSPTLVGGIVYVGSGQRIYAFNAAGCGQLRCSPLWSTSDTGQTMDTTPVVANSVLYAVSQQGTLYAFNANTGAQLWSAVTTLNKFARAPIVAGGKVYVTSTDNNLYAFNANGCGAATCSPLWEAAAGGPLDSIPALANGVVYIGSDDHYLYAFNANGCGSSTCSPLWKAATGGQVLSWPAVANGVVYAGSEDGKMYAFPAAGCGSATCSALWSYQTGGAIWSGPVVVNGVLYFGANDATLYAVHLPTSSVVCTDGTCRRSIPGAVGR